MPYRLKYIDKKDSQRVAGLTGGRLGKQNFAGNFELDGTSHGQTFELYDLDSFDIQFVKDVPIKANEKIYRYLTDTTRAGKIEPLVKVNAQQGLAYFNVADTDTEDILFSRKGHKMRFMNLLESKTMKTNKGSVLGSCGCHCGF